MGLVGADDEDGGGIRAGGTVSTTDLGNQAEDHARRALEDRGYLCDQSFQRIRTRWSRAENDTVEDRQEDFFGLFDVLGLGEDLRAVQTTHPSGEYERRQAVKDAIGDQYPTGLPDWLRVEVWVWQGAGFHVWELTAKVVQGERVKAWIWAKQDAVPVEVTG